MIFVSYSWTGGKVSGFGNMELDMEGIFTFSDLLKVTEIIKVCYGEHPQCKDGSVDIVILNWRRFDGTEPPR